MSTVTTTQTDNKVKLKPVNMWRVVLHNDDFTPMDFVTAVLVRYFHKNMEEAERIMMSIHLTGRGVAGVFTKEIAQTKVHEVTDVARRNGHPLLLTAEEA